MELPGTVEGGSVKDTVAEVVVEDVMVALAGTGPLSQSKVGQSVSVPRGDIVPQNVQQCTPRCWTGQSAHGC